MFVLAHISAKGLALYLPLPATCFLVFKLRRCARGNHLSSRVFFQFSTKNWPQCSASRILFFSWFLFSTFFVSFCLCIFSEIPYFFFSFSYMTFFFRYPHALFKLNSNPSRCKPSGIGSFCFNGAFGSRPTTCQRRVTTCR